LEEVISQAVPSHRPGPFIYTYHKHKPLRLNELNELLMVSNDLWNLRLFFSKLLTLYAEQMPHHDQALQAQCICVRRFSCFCTLPVLYILLSFIARVYEYT